MRSISILLGLVLAIGARGDDPTKVPPNPLDGKTFRSLDKLPGGERRDGSVNQIHWQVRFKADSFTWLHYDKVVPGMYTIDAKTGVVTVKGGRPKATYDAKAGILTWDNRKYEALKAEK